MTTPHHPTIDEFTRLETTRMFLGIIAGAGGINKVHHNRVPTALDEQTVIRMNRDTLYSYAIVDLAQGATITMPNSGGRYASLMIVNHDHFINEVIHDAGTHTLTIDKHGTRWVLAALRVFVDPNDPADVAAANDVQDGFAVAAFSEELPSMPDIDMEAFEEMRHAVLACSKFLPDARRCFGSKDEVEPVRHLLGTAFGWGGLPEYEAFYANVVPGLPVGEYQMVLRDVPCDAFWSISLYNADGFFEAAPDGTGLCSVNNVTGVHEADGSVIVRFGGDGSKPNTLRIMDGWNFIVRVYRARQEVLDGTWQVPAVEPVG